MERCCETCRYDLGGGYNNCKINLEAECAEGGYEAWEPKENYNQYISKDGTVFAIETDNRGLVGDYFFSPQHRYLDIGNRRFNLTCGSCTKVGYCQYCPNRWQSPVQK